MTGATLIWRNLGRNKLRSALTVAAVAVSLFLVTMFDALVRCMRAVAASSAGQLRLVVHERTTMTSLLPLGYGGRIRAVPGVDAVCAVRWFGGRLSNSSEQFPSLAGEAASLPAVYSDFDLRPDELAAWQSDRTAAIVGTGLARRQGWTRGQRVTLRGGIPPYPVLEFHIVGITAAPAYPNLFALRLDYLLDALRTAAAMPNDYADAVNFFWVKTATPAALEATRTAIDAEFAHATVRTRTEFEESFVASFTRMFGDIPGIVQSVGLLVLVLILLVVANTMTIAIRDRAGELAVLKAVGYSPHRIALLILGESILLGLLGGLLGGAPALLAGGSTTGDGLSIPYFPIIHVSPLAVLLGIALGGVVGLLAGLPPARAVAVRPVAVTLRSSG